VIVPSRGGVFEVTVGDDVIHSKKATGEYPEAESIIADVRSRIG
jgi:selT/selW/selH-like putative selenoprotein